ncbi:MAG: hypothetical protein ABIG43_05100, partial [Chloroflexota bacterium]
PVGAYYYSPLQFTRMFLISFRSVMSRVGTPFGSQRFLQPPIPKADGTATGTPPAKYLLHPEA